MENAGKLIEEEELREQIKGAGIGTSATRGGIIEKLEKIKYIEINKKTQIITPVLRFHLRLPHRSEIHEKSSGHFCNLLKQFVLRSVWKLPAEC